MNQLDRLNRAVVTVLGLLLIAAGGYGVLRSFNWQDVLGSGADQDPLLLDDVREAFNENDWLWWLIAAVALLVAWIGWKWLRLQLLPSPSLSTLHLPTGDDSRTELPASAFSAAVATCDLENDPSVTSARVRLVGSDDEPELDLRVGIADRAAATTVRSRIESDVLPRARWALQREDLRATVRLRLGDPTERVLS